MGREFGKIKRGGLILDFRLVLFNVRHLRLKKSVTVPPRHRYARVSGAGTSRDDVIHASTVSSPVYRCRDTIDDVMHDIVHTFMTSCTYFLR